MPATVAAEAIRSALREIRVPLIGSTITPIVVFLPLISITGVTGVFFRALAVTVGVSLFTSLASGPDLDADPEPLLHRRRKQPEATQRPSAEDTKKRPRRDAA